MARVLVSLQRCSQYILQPKLTERDGQSISPSAEMARVLVSLQRCSQYILQPKLTERDGQSISLSAEMARVLVPLQRYSQIYSTAQADWVRWPGCSYLSQGYKSESECNSLDCGLNLFTTKL